MKLILMKCGHVANVERVGIDGELYPCCVICAPKKEAYEVQSIQETELFVRTAKCTYCDQRRPSDLTLPFLEYCPDKDFDEYYCGCRGWD